MEITWHGYNCFRLSERGRPSIVTDPFAGAPAPERLRADIVTISRDSPRHNHRRLVKGVKRVIDSPGEYEIGGVFITGIPLYNARQKTPQLNVAYIFRYGGLTIAHLGALNYVPGQSQIESMNGVEICLTPIGGGGLLNASQAAEVVTKQEPKKVQPKFYQTSQTGSDLQTAARFLKAMGINKAAEQESLKIARGKLPEQTQVILLLPKL